MPIEFHGSDIETLLDHLENVASGQQLEDSQIDTIMESHDVDIWLKAYDPWIPKTRMIFSTILRSLHIDSTDFQGALIDDMEIKWSSFIDQGFRAALQDIEKLRSSLEVLSEFDWTETGKNTLKYLPESTPLDAHIIATIDGFNGGMFRGNYTFLSLLMMDPTTLRPEKFTHEFHHSGFSYWWKKHPLVVRHHTDENTREKWILNLYDYFVSEGLANAYCSPSAIELVEGSSELVEKHNQIVSRYESNIDEIIDIVESIMTCIIGNNLESIKAEYDSVALDLEGGGLPKGHFLSGRMVQLMEQSSSVEQSEIISLVTDPFQFFHLYNKAASDLGNREISHELIGKLAIILKEMESN